MARDDAAKPEANVTMVGKKDGEQPNEEGVLDSAASKSKDVGKKLPPKRKSRTRRPRRKKPRDMPRRPLSAYNYFFRDERARILEERKIRGKGDGSNSSTDDCKGGDLFSALGKIIAKRWKELGAEEAEKFKDMAVEDMKRYRRDMEEYNAEAALQSRLHTELGRGGNDAGLFPRRDIAESPVLGEGTLLMAQQAVGGVSQPLMLTGNELRRIPASNIIQESFPAPSSMLFQGSSEPTNLSSRLIEVDRLGRQAIASPNQSASLVTASNAIRAAQTQVAPSLAWLGDLSESRRGLDGSHQRANHYDLRLLRQRVQDPSFPSFVAGSSPPTISGIQGLGIVRDQSQSMTATLLALQNREHSPSAPYWQTTNLHEIVASFLQAGVSLIGTDAALSSTFLSPDMSLAPATNAAHVSGSTGHQILYSDLHRQQIRGILQSGNIPRENNDNHES